MKKRFVIPGLFVLGIAALLIFGLVNPTGREAIAQASTNFIEPDAGT